MVCVVAVAWGRWTVVDPVGNQVSPSVRGAMRSVSPALLAAYAPNPAILIVATTEPIRITDDPEQRYGSAACSV